MDLRESLVVQMNQSRQSSALLKIPHPQRRHQRGTELPALDHQQELRRRILQQRRVCFHLAQSKCLEAGAVVEVASTRSRRRRHLPQLMRAGGMSKDTIAALQYIPPSSSISPALIRAKPCLTWYCTITL